MKILAIESSGMTASVAVMQEDRLIGVYSVNNKKTHSQTLLPMIDEIVKKTQTDLNNLDAIAVSAGPGSFTGLRIGSATAKGLGLALDKPIVTVPTLEAMAYNYAGSDKVICPMMDARRQRAYTGIYDFQNGRINALWDQTVEPIDVIADKINEIGKSVVFLGDGADVYKSYLIDNIKVDYQFAPLHMTQQSAASVAFLGMEMLKEGKAQSAASHKTIYLRPSQAEAQKMKSENQES